MQQIVVARRFNGPPDSGNGGYTCGLFAVLAGVPDAEVTLRRPPPLDVPLRVHDDGTVYDGDTVVATASPADGPGVTPPAFPGYDAAHAARERYAGLRDHPFPTCFVCGPHRRAGDGMRLFVGPIAGRSIVAGPWVPGASFADGDGWIRPEIVWAALDCPSGWISNILGDEVQAAVLGRMRARIEGRIAVDERCVAIAWPEGSDGRKSFAGSAVYGEDGSLRGVARTTWIVPATAF